MRSELIVFIVLFFASCASHPGPTKETSENSFSDVEFVSCYDGDTCYFNLTGVHPLFGKRIGVRLRGIDTPEIKGKCEAEKKKAKEARDFLSQILSGSGKISLEDSQRINLANAKRGKYFRIIASVVADGRDVSELLLEKDFAVPYHGRGPRADWCGKIYSKKLRSDK